MTKTILVPVEPPEESLETKFHRIECYLGQALKADTTFNRGYFSRKVEIELASLKRAVLTVRKPILADDREEVARAISNRSIDNMLDGDEDPTSVAEWRARRPDVEDYALADAAISTVQGLGWRK